MKLVSAITTESRINETYAHEHVILDNVVQVVERKAHKQKEKKREKKLVRDF